MKTALILSTLALCASITGLLIDNKIGWKVYYLILTIINAICITIDCML